MKIAIQGHLTRGKEVIQILKSLGGTNSCNYSGNNFGAYYELHGNSIVCMSTKSDNYKYYTLEEFEKEFPFKIGDKVTIIGIPNYPKVITKMTWMDNEILYTFGDNTWYNTGALRKLEMKEERNITLTLDKAKEWYNKGGELKEIALQAFSEKELNPLPRSWEEFCERCRIEKDESYINSEGKILSFVTTSKRSWDHVCPSKESAEAHLAMIQLEQLRDCWRQGWVPDYTKTYKKYRIKKLGTEYIVDWSTGLSDFLVFQTEELAKEFLKCFRDLIEKAGDLI